MRELPIYAMYNLLPVLRNGGFIKYRIFLTFFNLLGPVVNDLQYWGSKVGAHVRNPENQLFMALVKLRLNLMTKRYRSLG